MPMVLVFLINIFLMFFCLESTAFSNDIPVNYRLDYLQLRIPDQSPSLGLVGAHLDIKPIQTAPWFYLGAGGYGAVRGQNSGFFALGLETGVQKNIKNNLSLETGIFLGTGGGHDLASVIGNGGFIETHAGVLYNFGDFLLGPDLSHWQFFSGNIPHNQIMLTLIFPSDIFAKYPEALSKNNNKNYFAMNINSEFPSNNSRDLSDNPMSDKLGLIGAEFGHYFNHSHQDSSYLFLNMNGAVYGNQNGYAEALAGLGYQKYLTNKFSILTQMGAGSAGGGGVDTRGGLIIEPELGLEFDPNISYGIALMSGYLWTPDLSASSRYQAWVAGVHFKYYFDALDPSSNIHSGMQAWRVRVGDQWYTDPNRENTNASIQLLTIKLDGFFNTYFYLTGQTSFAYTGDAAGYFSGMIGPGLQTNSYHRFRLYGEFLGGAAGGAGLDIGTGFLLEPLVGIRYDLNPSLGFYGSLGDTFSPNHSFSTPTIDFGVSGTFGAE